MAFAKSKLCRYFEVFFMGLLEFALCLGNKPNLFLKRLEA